MAAMMTMVSVAKTEVHPLLAAGVQQAILLAEISIAFAKGCADALPGALKTLLDKIPIEAVAAGVVIMLILSAITGTSTTAKKSKKGKGSKDDSDSDSISSEAEEILEELIDLYIEEHGSEPTEDEFLKWTETLKQATVDHASSPKKGKKTPTKKAAAKAGKKGELVLQKSPAKSASKSSKKAAAPKKVASSDSKAAVVFAEECVKWQKALPAKEQAKLEKQLAAAKTPAQSKAAFLASAAADKTKGRAARKEALLKAAMKV